MVTIASLSERDQQAQYNSCKKVRHAASKKQALFAYCPGRSLSFKSRYRFNGKSVGKVFDDDCVFTKKP
jgi:hypothetical protein